MDSNHLAFWINQIPAAQAGELTAVFYTRLHQLYTTRHEASCHYHSDLRLLRVDLDFSGKAP
jgi:hypothetical protein